MALLRPWRARVESGQTLKVNLEGRYLRIRHVALDVVYWEPNEGEETSDSDRTEEFLTEPPEGVEALVYIDEEVLTTLNSLTKPQCKVNWAADRSFTLTHTGDKGTIYLLGDTTKKLIYKPGVHKISFLYDNSDSESDFVEDSDSDDKAYKEKPEIGVEDSDEEEVKEEEKQKGVLSLAQAGVLALVCSSFGFCAAHILKSKGRPSFCQ